MTSATKAQKRELRSELIAARARLSQEERLERSRQVAERLLGLPVLAGARVVALYAALGTEVDTSVIQRRLQAEGVRCLYPRAVEGERRLVFAVCAPAELVRGPLGAAEPPPDARVVELDDVDAIVMPGVGFSEDGLRLGRGGGYYDVTLKEVPRAARVGLGFELQLRPTLPRDPHDVPLDAVVTEARTLLFSRSPKP
jgi:5-formyltetrahydrofolate cyclo-ligase